MIKAILNHCLILMMAALLIACEQGTQSPVEIEAGQRFRQLVDAYFDEALELDPVWATTIGDHRFDDRFANNISPQHRQRDKELQLAYLTKVTAIDPQSLTSVDRQSRELFIRDRKIAIEGLNFPNHLLPLNQMFNRVTQFVQMGSGRSVHPFETLKDYLNFISRIDDFAIWVDQAIANMKQGVEQGITQPRVVMERVLPQLTAHIVSDARDSLFYQPLNHLPELMTDTQRDLMVMEYETAIMQKLVPGFQRLRDYVESEYIPNCRSSVGLLDLPNGDQWYRYLVRQRTTTALSPAQIHQLGLDEVERIHGEMLAVIDLLGFEGELKEFFKQIVDNKELYFQDKDEMLASYRGLKNKVRESLSNLFNVVPKADFNIRAIEEYREKSAPGAHYQRPSQDGKRSALFYVNTYRPETRPRWSTETLYIHEAEPGHHFQIAIQQEIEGLPKFRRFGNYTAYSEGWALYAESLGTELGQFSDPYQYLGHLSAELWRAVRLVVDTGLHSKGWSRQQVLDYMFANTAVTEPRAVAEAERYMVMPAQALSYKIGQLKIRELRNRSEEQLGQGFDVRKFHDQVLLDGALPLNILEAKIDAWIKNQAATG